MQGNNSGNWRGQTEMYFFVLCVLGPGLKYDSVLQQLNTSLESLKRKSVEVFYLHAPDHKTPIEETLKAVDKLHKGRNFHTSGFHFMN